VSICRTQQKFQLGNGGSKNSGEFQSSGQPGAAVST
jgi:hypothetical protein